MNNNDQKDIPLPWTFQLLRNMGMTGLAWSLRRLYVPIPSGALVLDIGSGDNPYPRANVLLDASLSAWMSKWPRLWVPGPLYSRMLSRGR